MKSFSQSRNLYGSLTRNVQSENLTLGDQLINDSIRAICAMKDWPFLEKVRTLTTVANTQGVNLPYDCDQVREISVVPLGQTTRFVPKLSPSDAHWDMLNQSTFTSDQTEWYLVREGQILLYPTPVQTGNTIYVAQKTLVIDLNTADITATTIATLANGATTLTVNVGLTPQMVGWYIRPTYSSVANTGDGRWYELSGITSGTVGTLVRKYGGVSITAGTAACTLAQMPILPEAFHETPIKRAVSQYWAQQGDINKSLMYEKQYNTDIATLVKMWSSPTTSMVIDDGREDDSIINPNLRISL